MNAHSGDITATKYAVSNSKPYGVQIGRAILYLGDAAEVLPNLDDIDAVVTDGPYGLSFMGKSWDYDVPKASLWAMVMAAMKPGAHLVNFAGSRTYHRMAVEVEDGGFEIRDQLLWLYGSGFPKSHDIGKAVEAQIKTGGAAPINQRKAAMGDDYEPTPLAGTEGYGQQGNMFRAIEGDRTEWERPPLELTTPEAQQWQGWGTALKPGHEPIVLARKPFKGSTTANVIQHGTGALNIDACRVPGDNPSIERRKGSTNHLSTEAASVTESQGKLVSRQSPEAYRAPRAGEELGRWPANVMHDGSDAVVSQFPKVRTGKGSKNQRGLNAIYSGRRIEQGAEVSANGGDDGNAARFFYCAKASTKEREVGLEEFNKKLPVFFQTANGTSGKTSPMGADCGAKKERANIHPTVKPIALMKWLCRLITPPGGVILDLFLGSGSTGVAALDEGFFFVGIERDPDYFEIALARIAAAQGLTMADAVVLD